MPWHLWNCCEIGAPCMGRLPPHAPHFTQKWSPPIWKRTPPPLKHETPFHEMIPRKSTINNNLQSKILEKDAWRSSFLVNLEACRLIACNFFIKWTPSQVFFDSILSSPNALPCFDLSPPPIKFWGAIVRNTCGKPGMHMLLPLKVGVYCIYVYSLSVWDSRDIRGLYFDNFSSEKYILA